MKRWSVVRGAYAGNIQEHLLFASVAILSSGK